MINYIKMDLYRSIYSYQFIVGVLGAFLVMVLGTFEGINMDTSVVYVFYIVNYGMLVLMRFIFCAFPYGGCFCEDYENKYIQLEIIRGSLNKYILSKILTIVLTSVVTMMLSILIYVLCLRCFIPWSSSNENILNSLMTSGGFRLILRNEHFILYYILYGLQVGLLAGILSLIGSYMSLYISNKLLLLAIPSMAYYFLNQVLSKISKGRIILDTVFFPDRNIFNNDFLSFFFAIGITVFFILIMYYAICRKMKRRMKHE